MTRLRKTAGPRGPLLAAAAGLCLLAAACRGSDGALPPLLVAPPADAPVTAAAGAPEADRWYDLLTRTPFPYTEPLPEPAWTAIDGVYVHTLPTEAEHVHCRRCPDYLPEGGIWRVSFDRGVMRILHEDTGWRNLASYTVDGDTLRLFNDPVCPTESGEYRWSVVDGALAIEPVADVCAIRLRAANLGSQPWQSCRPPNQEAAVTGHWPAPDGCR